MIKYIRLSIGFLVAGTAMLSLGVTGSLSVKADVVRDFSETLYRSAQVGVFAGTTLIVLSGVFFIVAISKSQE